MLEQNDTGALRLGRFKGGRTYFVNKYNEVCLIECACCKEIKPATAFHTNHFKKFNKQNYCIACNDKRLSRKVRDKKDTPKEPKTTKVAKVVNIEDYRTEPVYIYLIPFGGGKVYITYLREWEYILTTVKGVLIPADIYKTGLIKILRT